MRGVRQTKHGMRDDEIVTFARSNLELIGGSSPGYRCAATLNDGLRLPCVLISDKSERAALALRRFEETRRDATLEESKQRWGKGMKYDDIVRNFVAVGNHVNAYDIASL